MNRFAIVFLILTFSTIHSFTQTYRFDNGLVFQNGVFQKIQFFVHNGKIEEQITKQPDSIINLDGKYVIPPFAEAHNHSLESSYDLQNRLQNFMRSGIFYAKIMSSIKKRLDPLLINYNKPSSVDITHTYAPITATGGHPIKIREMALKRGDYTGLYNNMNELNKEGFWIMNTAQDVNDLWDEYIAQKPPFLKVMLLFSEEYEKRKNDTTYYGNKGIDPTLLPYIVEKAHRQGIKVAAHVESGTDFHNAIVSGVDEIAHLPCLYKKEQLSLDDIKLAAEKKIPVTTTLSLLKRISDTAQRAILKKNAIVNLKLLHQYGVPILIGSDDYYDNSVNEYLFLRSLNVFTPETLLTYWINTAAFIFPERKIAAIKQGFEASFLVLNENPLISPNAIKSISMYMKQGIILKL